MHRQQIANPSAKLDDAIIKNTARYFGVTERTVWRALKYHEAITGSRDPVRVVEAYMGGAPASIWRRD